MNLHRQGSTFAELFPVITVGERQYFHEVRCLNVRLKDLESADTYVITGILGPSLQAIRVM